jgi:hypothetical protein
MTIFTYNLNTLVSSSNPELNCGVYIIDFMYANGNALDTIFIDNRSFVGSFSLQVFTGNELLAGEYSLVFRVTFAAHPSVVVVSQVFVVVVVNPCVPPPLCITIIGCGIPPPTVTPPAINISIDVTVSVEVNYDIPSWGCSNPGCTTQITPVCIDCNIGGGGGAVVVIVNNVINININSCVDICVDDPNGSVHVIVIQGCLGTSCIDIDVDVIIYNPCLDPDQYQILPVPMTDINYVLFETGVFTHAPFQVIGTQAIIDICGALIYTIDCDLNVYIDYNPTTHIIIIYCDDMTTLQQGSYDFTITVNISIYVSVTVSSGGTIVIVDPCLSAVLEIAVPTHIIVAYGDLGTFTMPQVTVTPGTCGTQVIFTCAYVSGPYVGSQNLCSFSFNNGVYSTTASFDMMTGTYQFTSNDITSFPPGEYNFRITASIHSSVKEIIFKMTLQNTCSTAPVAINFNPFSVGLYEYVLGSQGIEIPYDLNTICNIQPSLICGSPAIQFLNGQYEPIGNGDAISPDYVNQILRIGYSDDITLTGTKYRLFKCYNTLRPDQPAFSDVFTVKIIDGCNPPADFVPQLQLVAPTFETIVYTIG